MAPSKNRRRRQRRQQQKDIPESSPCDDAKRSPPSFHSRLISRPAFWTCLITLLAYWDFQALHGKFIYDDATAIVNNIVVTGKVPWQEAFTRDFWGSLMKEPKSHKSFRPITTLSFRLNWILAEKLGLHPTSPDFTFGFHVSNVVLHGIVTGMVTEAASYVFCGGTDGDVIAQLATGLIFGLHPIHAEAVSNITSRGELLMSFFCLLAFLSYANQIRKLLATGRVQRMPWSRGERLVAFLGVSIVPWMCMTLSIFSKEQGATTLISLVAYDFLQHFASVKYYFKALQKRDVLALSFLRRTIILAIQTLAVCFVRYMLNGESSPDFVLEQNPAGFSPDRFTRVFSVNWVYCLYIFDAVFPKYLCPDWSGVSIDLIERATDIRIVAVIVLWCFAAGCVWSLFAGLPATATKQERDARRIALQAFFAFMISPFLLSSNLLVVVGLMKADRVVYLPLFGFCVLVALLLKIFFCDSPQDQANNEPTPSSQQKSATFRPKNYWLGYVLFMTTISLYCGKLHERNLAWSDPFRLWLGAYAVNKKSHHTMYNCGNELNAKKMYNEAELVLRPIGRAHVAGPSNCFLYSLVLYSLQRCDLVNIVLQEAFVVFEENRKAGGKLYSRQDSGRTESNLFVAKALCEANVTMKGQLLYKALQADQTNEFAIGQFTFLMNKLEEMKRAGIHIK